MMLSFPFIFFSFSFFLFFFFVFSIEFKFNQLDTLFQPQFNRIFFENISDIAGKGENLLKQAHIYQSILDLTFVIQLRLYNSISCLVTIFRFIVKKKKNHSKFLFCRVFCFVRRVEERPFGSSGIVNDRLIS